MGTFSYTIKVAAHDGPQTVMGSAELDDCALHVVENLPEGVIESVTGTIYVPLGEHERVFMNGFQTWTYCKEYTNKDKIRGLHYLPKFAVDKFKFDRYGDYHFVDYPNRRGVTHGFSYCYFRDGEFYRLFASLDEEPGYTMFRYDANKGVLTIERDCAGLKCGGEFHAFDLYETSGQEDDVFDRWFAQMNVKPITDKKIKGYSSWYNRYENISEKSIMEDLGGCAKVLDAGDLFQVDDGWEPNVGDWLEPDYKKFPQGMKPVADAIHEKGFMAGLWLAPFVCNVKSKIVTEHPDWLYRVNGEPWFDGCNWGGFYSLDIDNPEVIDYVRETFRRVFDEWGFDLVKLDFLYGAAPFGNDRETRAGRMIRAMKLLREVCGEHPILGCGVPVMTAFGLVEYCRVSCDVTLDWNDKPFMRIIHRERPSTKQALETGIFRRQLNGRAYLSDPDVFFLRDDNLKFTETQKRNIAAVERVMGGVWLTSDNMGKYSDEKRAYYRELASMEPVGKVRVDAENGL